MHNKNIKLCDYRLYLPSQGIANTVGESASLGSNDHDQYPDSEHHVGDGLVSPSIQKILQSSASIMKTHEQNHVSDSEDREDPLEHLRTIRRYSCVYESA